MTMPLRSTAIAIVLGIALWNVNHLVSAGDKTGPSKDAIAKAETALKEHLEKAKATGGQIVHLQTAALTKDFPQDIFFALRFRLFPVARVLPKGMKASNIFVVSKEGKVKHLHDAKELEKYFQKHLPAIKKQEQAQDALGGWLLLAQEFHQDGFFTFEILSKAFAIEEKGKGYEAAGRAMVMKGGNGELSVTLTFADGKLTKVADASKVRPGPRPICQATKLLDADAIVRKMAEQDLLIMGLAAKEYLDEQRAQARPELRQAIDRLWQQIQKNGW
jgi:hypothetical protein